MIACFREMLMLQAYRRIYHRPPKSKESEPKRSKTCQQEKSSIEASNLGKMCTFRMNFSPNDSWRGSTRIRLKMGSSGWNLSTLWRTCHSFRWLGCQKPTESSVSVAVAARKIPHKSTTRLKVSRSTMRRLWGEVTLSINCRKLQGKTRAPSSQNLFNKWAKSLAESKVRIWRQLC